MRALMILKLISIFLCFCVFIVGLIDLFFGTGLLGIFIFGISLLLMGQLSRAGRDSGTRPEGEAGLSNIRIQSRKG
jgi:hypothetical protein